MWVHPMCGTIKVILLNSRRRIGHKKRGREIRLLVLLLFHSVYQSQNLKVASSNTIQSQDRGGGSCTEL